MLLSVLRGNNINNLFKQFHKITSKNISNVRSHTDNGEENTSFRNEELITQGAIKIAKMFEDTVARKSASYIHTYCRLQFYCTRRTSEHVFFE